MDAEYFIEIILQGRDNLTATLAKASAELRAFKAEAEGLSSATDRVTVSQTRQAGASRNSSQAAERAVIAANREVAVIKDKVHTMHMLDLETQRLLRSNNALEKGFGRVRQAALGIQRQFFDLRRGVRDMDYATRQAQGAFFNFAYNASRGFDNAVKSLTRMNTVAALLAPVIFSLVTAVLNLAAALISVASAATLAAAAIGGALVAGVMQAIPVVGLLVAAVGRLKAVLNASTLLQKEHIRSTRDLAGEERKNARDLVDIQNQKIDAILAEKSARLSLLEAKQRLRDMARAEAQDQRELGVLKGNVTQAQQALALAQATGDPAAISAALSQLATAQQQFNAAKNAAAANTQDLEKRRAQLAVQEAAQRQKEATIARQRAVEDAARAKRTGYVTKPQGAAGEDAAQQALKGLDPTERRLLAIVDRFKALWKKATRPLTDAILDAIGDAIQTLEKLFADKNFMAAWRGLATTIGNSIRELARFFTSPEQRAFFTSFINLANKNLPTIVRIFEQIFTLVEKIALAFAPVFSHILGGVSGFLGRQNERAGQPARAGAGFQQNRLGAFAERSQGFLDQFMKFLGAFFHFLGAVIGVAAGPGGTALERMTAAFQRWADELNGPKHQAAREFFLKSIEISGQILEFFGKLIKVLFDLSQNSAFTTFLTDLETIGLPALKHVGEAYGGLFRILAVAASQPGLKQITEIFVALVLASKIVPGVGFALRQIIRGLARGTAALAARVGASRISGAIGKFLNPEVTAIEQTAAAELAAKAAQTATLVEAITLGGAGGGFSGRKMGKAEGDAYWKARDAERALGRETVTTTTRLGRLRGALNRWGARLPIVGGIMTRNLLPATNSLILKLGLRAGLAGVALIAGYELSKVIRRIPILGGALQGLGKILGSLAYDAVQWTKRVAKAAADSPLGAPGRLAADLFGKGDSGGEATLSPRAMQAYRAWSRAHPHATAKQRQDAFKRFAERYGGSYDQGGEVGGAGLGAAVPITAHVGEWVLNQGQQSQIAHALGLPVGLIKEFLFGKSRGESMSEHIRKRKQARRLLAGVGNLAHGFDNDRMGQWFGFSPDIDDWAGTELGVPGGEGTAAQQKAREARSPLFIDTPLGQYVNLARNDLQYIIKSKGFWIPEYVKRAQGYAGATRAQINAWKRGHVMRGLGIHEGEGGQAAIGAIMRSKLWSYGSGGVVGFQPASVPHQSFAAGGVVARGATPKATGATKQTNQTFEIITASPKVDIDYVMRVAKIHAESG
jgi:hypothetical protein